MHGVWCLLTDDVGTPVRNKTWWETDALAREMSERFNKRLTLIPVKTAEILCKTDEAFKEMMVKYWIWNAETMKTCKNTEELKKKLGLKTTHVYQWSNDDGISSVRSAWDSGGGCFDANADRPSYWDDYGVVAFLVDFLCILAPENKPHQIKLPDGSYITVCDSLGPLPKLEYTAFKIVEIEKKGGIVANVKRIWEKLLDKKTFLLKKYGCVKEDGQLNLEHPAVQNAIFEVIQEKLTEEVEEMEKEENKK
jgi:hypothetical protein